MKQALGSTATAVSAKPRETAPARQLLQETALGVDRVIALQRTAGNRAVTGLLSGSRPTSGPVLPVQRVFAATRTTGKSHLRERGRWGDFKGPAIPTGTSILVDIDDARRVSGRLSRWRPALNIPPDNVALLADDRRGYIRSSKVDVGNANTYKEHVEQQIHRKLRGAETAAPWLDRKLETFDHVKFLMNKAIRSDTWVNGEADTFRAGLQTLDEKMTRIQAGAEYVAKVLVYWKKWLYPPNGDGVTLEHMKLVESDLHERGLGVVEVRFKKPAGGTNPQYSGQTEVHAFIKPEDKSLEQNLLGFGPNSAASKINNIAGLVGNEQIRTIKMQSTPGEDYGTFVEAAKGVKTEDYFLNDQANKEKGQVQKSFHETLIFAYLAGIDDLHKKNVYFDKQGDGTPGMPTLIDADVVMSWSQMNKNEQESSGKGAQSGFSQYNRAEATKNQQAVMGLDNSQINSKILNVMLTDQPRRRLIMTALQDAIRGHKGRVVPVKTGAWGGRLNNYGPANHETKANLLDDWSAVPRLVRKGIPFSPDVGPGLYGTAGENAAGADYQQATERAQIKADFDMGSIPFYEYDYTTGHVTHNGHLIYKGVTLDQAMNQMLQRFGG